MKSTFLYKHQSIVGQSFFNYKEFYSIVIFVVVDANYNFMYATVGCQGRISDVGVLTVRSSKHDLKKTR